MQKAQFDMIADVIRQTKEDFKNSGIGVLAALEVLENRFAERLGETNALFNTDRFLAACRGEDSKDSAGRKVRYSEAAHAGITQAGYEAFIMPGKR